ncbi:hypothetical protein G6011_00949 [Alternaria panax]|uniref:Uncharacterized protein n=1 Tax=Alternaria panax TaxID=48097 RepID=A0AAD4IJ79_9PLEO|nr:hypothetical protein G6011_00949 [Alternaria panax]
MPVRRREGPTKQRQITLRRSIDPLPLLAAPEPTKLQERRASEGKSKRPPRWRGPQHNNTSNMQQRSSSIVLPERDRIPARDVQGNASHQPSQPQNIQLRFSFSQSFVDDVERQLHSENEARFNRSFSGLSMIAGPNQSFSSSSSGSQSTEKASPVQHVSSQRSIYEEEIGAPVLTKPGKKKKEGYGFSYSETFMYDSDDYPDTECEWDPDAEGQEQEQETDMGTEPNTPTTPTSASWPSSNPYLKWDGGYGSQGSSQAQDVQQQHEQPTQQPTPRQSFSSSSPATSTFSGPSFDDLVVLRDVGSFHLTRPQRHLSCTHATREDTIYLKSCAQALLCRYKESASIQLGLLTRLERMLYAQQTLPGATEDSVARCLIPCAQRLERWLKVSKEERVATGEWKGVVEHEIES